MDDQRPRCIYHAYTEGYSKILGNKSPASASSVETYDFYVAVYMRLT